MRQLKLRFARKEESGQIVEWLNKNPINQFDSDILSYPSLNILCSYEGDGRPVAYLPSQQVLMAESVAISPEADEQTRAQALRDLIKGMTLLGSQSGIREIYFLDGSGGVADLAKHHGFEELNFRVFRMKLK